MVSYVKLHYFPFPKKLCSQIFLNIPGCRPHFFKYGFFVIFSALTQNHIIAVFKIADAHRFDR
jgi:hypothetical protein